MGREDTALALNRMLANYFIIYIKLYRYQWYVKGEHSYSLLQFFKQLQKETEIEINELSTYILGIDGKPFATMIKFIKESTIEEAVADDEEEEMISELIQNYSSILKQIDDLINDTDESVRHFLYTCQNKLQIRKHLCQQMQK